MDRRRPRFLPRILYFPLEDILNRILARIHRRSSR